jgi:plastocyanin
MERRAQSGRLHFRLGSFLPLAVTFMLLGPAMAATFTGRVELADSRDPGVRKRKDFSGVVVWLDPLKGDAPAAPHRTAQMLQKGKKFVPHILAIPAGTTVEFPNFDPIFHNAFSNFSGQPFDTGLYAPGTSQRVLFKREGIVRVFCNIHATMTAVIVVTKSPYVAVTTKAGEFRIEGVPPGEYQMRIFHERAREDALNALARVVSIAQETVSLQPVRISESGYLEVPHRNKYGQDYPPLPDEHVVYPGVRK